MTGLNWKTGRRSPSAKAVHGSADEVFSVSGGCGIMIVLILFYNLPVYASYNEPYALSGHPVSLESDRYSGGRHQLFTEAVLVINSYRNSKNKVLEQKKSGWNMN